MSNAIIVPDTFGGQVAAVFAGQSAGDDLSGGITGGYGLIKYRGKVWSIQYHGASHQLMRDDGDGPRGSIEVVIVKANSQLSKTFYINGWDESNNNPPDCASANGITPDQGVPHKQADVCAMCPKNAWNSAPNGGKGKACGDHRRMAVVPLTDLRNEGFGGPLLLRCPAASLQDMAAFDARYKGMGYPYFTMGIKIAFDPQESFPKFTFAGIRPLTAAEGTIVMELRNSPETARVVNEGSAPAVAQIAQQAAPAFLEPIPADAIKPQQVTLPGPTPVASAPVAKPQPVVEPAARAPEPVRVAERTSGGFGPVSVAPAPAAAAVAAPATAPAPAAAVAAPAAATPAPAKAPVQMTGFGAAVPEAAPAAAVQAPAPVAAAPVSPAVATAFDASLDDRLSALLQG